MCRQGHSSSGKESSTSPLIPSSVGDKISRFYGYHKNNSRLYTDAANEEQLTIHFLCPPRNKTGVIRDQQFSHQQFSSVCIWSNITPVLRVRMFFSDTKE